MTPLAIIPDLGTTAWLLVAVAGVAIVLAYYRLQDPGTNSTTDDDSDASDFEQEGRAAGGFLGSIISGASVKPAVAITSFTTGLLAEMLLVVTRPLPAGHKVWNAMHQAGVKGLKRSTGADIVGFIGRETGQVEAMPMKWKHAADDAEEGGRWHALSTDEEYNPGILGQKTDQIGRTPVAFFDEDDPYRASWLEARVAEAVDLGQGRPLYTPDTFNVVSMDADAGGDGHQPVADGGATGARTGPGNDFYIRDQGVLEQGTLDAALEDFIIDLSAGETADGMRVSWEKVVELQEEKTTTEEMQNQEMRGRIAEAGREGRDKWMRILLYFVIGVIAASMGPELIAAIFGSGAGSSIGSTLPFGVVPPLP